MIVASKESLAPFELDAPPVLRGDLRAPTEREARYIRMICRQQRVYQQWAVLIMLGLGFWVVGITTPLTWERTRGGAPVEYLMGLVMASPALLCFGFAAWFLKAYRTLPRELATHHLGAVGTIRGRLIYDRVTGRQHVDTHVDTHVLNWGHLQTDPVPRDRDFSWEVYPHPYTLPPGRDGFTGLLILRIVEAGISVEDQVAAGKIDVDDHASGA